MTILALEKDLFFAVRIRDTLRHHDHEVTVVRTLAAFEEALGASGDMVRPRLVIVNIASRGVDWEAAIRAALADDVPVLAFGSHMDLEARRRALEAGAGKVVANSKFVKDMWGLVEGMMNGAASTLTDEIEEND